MARSVADNAQEAQEQSLRLKVVKDIQTNDLRTVLEIEEGRRWVFSLLERCHVFHAVMTGNSYTFFNDGMRQVGLSVIEELALVNPDMFGKLFAESCKWKEQVNSIIDQEGENEPNANRGTSGAGVQGTHRRR